MLFKHLFEPNISQDVREHTLRGKSEHIRSVRIRSGHLDVFHENSECAFEDRLVEAFVRGQNNPSTWFQNASDALELGRGFYFWGGYANVANYPPAIKEAGLYFSQAIIWVKEWPVLTRKDYMGNHEWCFYGWKEGAAHYFNPGITNATDTWSVKKVTPQSMIHLTEKPVELAERAMMYSSRRDERVLDLFGGSGSTLMAAERMGRRALLMEIDTAYCDVIVERWQAHTSEKADGWRGNK